MLRLHEPGVALADSFHRGELPPQQIDQHPVLARWSRAAGLGVRPDGDAHPEGTTDADLISRRDRMGALFREESPLLAPIADELSARSMVAIVADKDGVVLLARGGGDFGAEAARVRLCEGSRWSEGTRGTNAIGTALAEACPVAVVGAAHFEERNHGLFCYATPLRDPYGDVVAALDVTGAIHQHTPAVGLAVQAAGAAIERALRLRAYAAATVGGYAVVERMLHRTGSPALLVEATGEVLSMNDAARSALGVGEGRALGVESVFGASMSALRGLATSPGGARFETASARYRLEVEPILGAGGRVLSLLVFLERLRTSLPPPSRPSASRADPPSVRRKAPNVHPAFDAILGRDPGIVDAKQMAARFAPTRLPVLLLAETGTGKELFARAIHAASQRAGAFVALNCGALAPSLLEAELFGYAPGAFTGAGRTGSEGKLGAASGGTLFLDEIAEMPEPLQAMLLRVLDDGEYYRLGDVRQRRADLRLVAATCQDLASLVASGRFRRDLFFRIQGTCVTIPALRARSDRLALTAGLLAELAASEGVPCPELEDDAVAWIMQHDWPGNVRELKSALAHALVMAAGEPSIGRSSFPRVLLQEVQPREVEAGTRTRGAILRDAAEDALRATSGNLSEAARRLGIARSTLYRMTGRKS